MRYIFDNDLHIHSKLSLCSNDPAQTTAAILAYAQKFGLKTICLTDHYWDENVKGAESFGFYSNQDYAHIAEALPLEKADGIEFLFGCETDMKADMTLGISKEAFDKFDFVVVPTTHLHMNGFTCRGDEDSAERAKLWIDRFDTLLDMDIPFKKVGLAHLTCSLMSPGKYDEVLKLIPDSEMERVFKKAAERGVGIELNFGMSELFPNEKTTCDLDTIMRPYRIAKKVGCKFYFASDAHHPAELEAEKKKAERVIDLLELTEDDKFYIGEN